MDVLKKKIEEITEGEPREAKRLLDEVTKKLEKTRTALNQVNVDIQAAERYVISFFSTSLFSKTLNSLFLLCGY